MSVYMTILDQQSASLAAPLAATVFYDGECPVCRVEVDFYSRIDTAKAIDWIDITQLTDSALPVGKTRQALLGRFHVCDEQTGAWHVGVDAFAHIWRQLPGFRRAAFVFGVPGLRQLAELGYRAFLKWQRWHRVRRAEQ